MGNIKFASVSVPHLLFLLIRGNKEPISRGIPLHLKEINTCSEYTPHSTRTLICSLDQTHIFHLHNCVQQTRGPLGSALCNQRDSVTYYRSAARHLMHVKVHFTVCDATLQIVNCKPKRTENFNFSALKTPFKFLH